MFGTTEREIFYKNYFANKYLMYFNLVQIQSFCFDSGRNVVLFLINKIFNLKKIKIFKEGHTIFSCNIKTFNFLGMCLGVSSPTLS